MGLGLVEALVDRGARVTVVARDKDALASVRQRLGVAVQPADVTDEGAAHRILAEVRPDILVLNAGAMFARAFVALDEMEEAPPLRAWLFRIAHNRALDLMRSRAIRAAEPIEAVYEVADPESPDPVEALMRREAVETAMSRFVELPTVQRSVVILKDVLDQSLEDIALLARPHGQRGQSPLARGRARLKAINAEAPAETAPRPPSPAVARYVALFNRRDWDGLRAMLADDVRLIQSSYPLRAGRADVSVFFGIYAQSPPARVGPAWLDGREVIAVWEDSRAAKPSYLMWLVWTDGRISFIRDYRHVPYVVDDAELVLASDSAPPG